jgi:hypothetical protein
MYAIGAIGAALSSAAAQRLRLARALGRPLATRAARRSARCGAGRGRGRRACRARSRPGSRYDAGAYPRGRAAIALGAASERTSGQPRASGLRRRLRCGGRHLGRGAGGVKLGEDLRRQADQRPELPQRRRRAPGLSRERRLAALPARLVSIRQAAQLRAIFGGRVPIAANNSNLGVYPQARCGHCCTDVACD